MKFLVDECLSPELVSLARARDFHESTHVTWLGMQSRQDWTIVRRAVQEGFVLVTNNAADFLKLIEREPIHAGLVCLGAAAGFMSLETQRSLFRLALDTLNGVEPINQAINVFLAADGTIVIDRYRLPPTA